MIEEMNEKRDQIKRPGWPAHGDGEVPASLMIVAASGLFAFAGIIPFVR
jgi:hypothetical protein